MIINIRGLSGSGKTTAVKNIMDLYENKEPFFLGKTKNPNGYKLTSQGINPLVVLGPYENKTGVGGCDTINFQDQIKVLIEHYSLLGYDILYESMQQSTSTTMPTWALDFGQVVVLFLDIPLEQIAKQRAERSIANGGTGVFETATGIITPESIENAFVTLTSDQRIITKRVTHSDIVLTAYELLSKQVVREVLQDNLRELYDLYTGAGIGVSRKAKENAKNTLFEW